MGTKRNSSKAPKVVPLPTSKANAAVQEQIDKAAKVVAKSNKPNGSLKHDIDPTLSYKVGMMSERVSKCSERVAKCEALLIHARADLAGAIEDREEVKSEIVKSLGKKLPAGYEVHNVTFEPSTAEFTRAPVEI